MQRLCIAIIGAAIIVACGESTPTQPSFVCDYDATYDDGFRAGVQSVAQEPCAPTHRYENDRRDVIVDGRRFHHEDYCTLNDRIPEPTDHPLDIEAAREWACQELRYAYVEAPGHSFRLAVGRVWGTTQDDTGAYTISFDTDTDARLAGAEANANEWGRRVRESARAALRCAG